VAIHQAPETRPCTGCAARIRALTQNVTYDA
jgi:hypothetical protein